MKNVTRSYENAVIRPANTDQEFLDKLEELHTEAEQQQQREAITTVQKMVMNTE